VLGLLRAKNSDFFTRGATTTEIAIVSGMVGLLVGVTVFALVLIIRGANGGGSPERQTDGKRDETRIATTRSSGYKYKPPTEYRVHCMACGAEWMVKPKDISKYQREGMGEFSKGGVYRPRGGDCPKCGAKGTVFVMIQCPNCGKYYLPARVKDPVGYAEGKVRDVCPYCGTDLKEWWKKHLKR